MAAKITRSTTRRPGTKKPPGRPKGSKDVKRQLAIAGKNRAVTKKILEKPGILPLEFMLNVMRNPKNSWAARQTAARDAAPFVHPRLASIVHKGDMREPIASVQMPADEFKRLAREVMKKV